MGLKVFFISLMLFLASILPTAADQDPFSDMFQENGDDFAEFEDIEAETQKELSEFEAEKQTELQAFKDERDRDFAELLKARWEAFKELEGLIKDPEPKPKVIPKASEQPHDMVVPKGERVKPLIPPLPPQEEEPIPQITPGPPELSPKPSPEEPKPFPETRPLPSVFTTDLQFYGLPIRISYDPAVAVPFDSPINKESISDYWVILSMADFEGLVNELADIRTRLKLNDWGYYQVVHTLGETIHSDVNSARLFAWFIMVKSGYRVKIGYDGNLIYLFAPTKGLIYQVPYCSIDGMKFYNLSYVGDQHNPGNIYTYKKDYPGSEHLITLGLQDTPSIHMEKQVRGLRFKYDGQHYDIPVEINRNLIRFYDSYPQTEWPVYLAAPTSPATETSLIQVFGKLVQGKRETEAVNMLLRFVQTAFHYQTDQEQFGREKYMFAEETLFSRSSDCEDRSFLFIYLVRRIIGLEAVALHYPGHMATAIRFSENVKGDTITINDYPYLICDPTYINSNIGMVMPKFKSIKPNVIQVHF